MGVSKERRHAGRAIRRRRRRAAAWQAIAGRVGLELYPWQIDVMNATAEARAAGLTKVVWLSDRRGGRFVFVAERAGL